MRKKWAIIGLLLVLVTLLVVISGIEFLKAEIFVPDDYPTIQEAVDNAPVGGTVFVRKGTYPERVIIRTSLKLFGEDTQDTVIDVPHLGGLTSYGAIEVKAEDVTISGFTIKNSKSGIKVTSQEYGRPPNSRCKIIDNTIVNNSAGGIITSSGSNHEISGNTITGNSDYGGILLQSSSGVISGNNITDNGRAGITLVMCSNVVVRNNSISCNDRGVVLRWDGPFYVYGNTITDNEGVGVEFGSGCYNSIVYQNNIERNSVGVNLLNFQLIGDATIGSGNVVYRNNFVDNQQQAVVEKECDLADVFPERSNGTDVVEWNNDKEGNYWSNYQTKYPSAAEVDNSGIGNTPYVIDENNTDHYPIMNPVTISANPPPILQLPLTITVSVAVTITVFVVILLIYRAYRKRKQSS